MSHQFGNRTFVNESCMFSRIGLHSSNALVDTLSNSLSVGQSVVCGLMVLWLYDFMVLWFYGVMFNGLIVVWFRGCVVSQDFIERTFINFLCPSFPTWIKMRSRESNSEQI